MPERFNSTQQVRPYGRHPTFDESVRGLTNSKQQISAEVIEPNFLHYYYTTISRQQNLDYYSFGNYKLRRKLISSRTAAVCLNVSCHSNMNAMKNVLEDFVL